MNVEMIQTLHRYNQALYRRLWDSIDTLDEADFVREFDYSLGSVRNHMVHLIGVDRRWLACLHGQPFPPYLRTEDYPTRATVRPVWDETAAQVAAYVDQLDDAQLGRVLHFTTRSGPHTNRAWEILLHMANHGTDHRSQLLRLLHDLGAPTFEHDLAGHLWGLEEAQR